MTLISTKVPQGFASVRKAVFAAVSFAALGLGLFNAGGAQAADTFEVLRKGGYTLFFRHTQSDWRTAAALPVAIAVKSDAKPELCAGERQLSDEGRADARALGLAVKSLNLTISEIASANLCRMQETAKIAFGAAKTVPDLAPRPGVALSLSAQAAAVERLTRTPLADHAIRIIVGDYEVAQALYGVTLAEGDAVVLKSGADGKPEPVARIRLADWRALAPVAASAALAAQGASRKF